MLFGYLNEHVDTHTDDIMASQTDLAMFAFDCPLTLVTELHVAGAMAFASCFGFNGMSLIQWSLAQVLESQESQEPQESQETL